VAHDNIPSVEERISPPPARIDPRTCTRKSAFIALHLELMRAWMIRMEGKMTNAELSYPRDLCASCRNITLEALLDTHQVCYSPGQKQFSIIYDDINSSMQICPLCKLFSQSLGITDLKGPSIVGLSRPRPKLALSEYNRTGRVTISSGSISSGTPEASKTFDIVDSIDIARFDGKVTPACSCGYSTQRNWATVGVAAENGM